MENRALENSIEGLGLSPNGRYFVFSESEDLYYLDITSKTKHKIGYLKSLRGGIRLAFSENSLTFVLTNSERILVYNIEAQAIQFDQTIQNENEAYLSEDGKNLVYFEELQTKERGHPFGPVRIHFYDLSNKKINRTADTREYSYNKPTLCYLGTCIAFRDLSGHAQVISMDGRTAWINPFLRMRGSDVSVDNRGLISVRAVESGRNLSEDIEHRIVVNLTTQREIFRTQRTDQEGWLLELQSLSDELFFGLTYRGNIKLLRSHGEVIDEIPWGHHYEYFQTQSRDLRYFTTNRTGLLPSQVQVIRIDKVNGKLKPIAQITTPTNIQAQEFTSDSNFLFVRSYSEVILTALETREQFKLSTEAKVIESAVFKQKPVALILEENGALGVIHFNKNQFQYQPLYKAPFEISKLGFLPKIFSSQDERIHVIWSQGGYSILKINDSTL